MVNLPPRKFEIGQTIQIPADPVRRFEGGEVRVICYEWGENMRRFNRPVWLYAVAAGYGEGFIYEEEDLLRWATAKPTTS